MIRRCTGLLLALLLAGVLCVPAQAVETGAISSPSALWADGDGLLLTDLYQKVVWRWTSSGTAQRLAGQPGTTVAGSAPLGGYQDGKAGEALFAAPWAVAPYGSGWAVSDTENHVVRLISEGQVLTLAGMGKAGLKDGTGRAAAFSRPTGLAPAPDGGLFVADTDNSVIRLIDKTGKVTTYAGGGEGCADGALLEARFLEPTGLYYDDGVLYVADSGNHRICQIEGGQVTTLAGGTEEGYVDGVADRACFASPQGVLAHDGTVYVADTGNSAVRVISGGRVVTLCAPGSSLGGLAPVMPRALAVWKDRLYVGDVFARTVLELDLYTAAEARGDYSDVPAKAWYAPAVAEVTRRGLMQGDGERFSPNLSLTRGMFVTILARIQAGVFPSEIMSGEAAFPDVGPDSYYAKAAAWAADTGLVQGVKGKFLPERAITRGELITLLHRYADVLGCDKTAEGTLEGYADASQVPAWAQEAFRWAAGHDLVGTGGNLAPARTATRAEAAQLITRFLNLAGV